MNVNNVNYVKMDLKKLKKYIIFNFIKIVKMRFYKSVFLLFGCTEVAVFYKSALCIFLHKPTSFCSILTCLIIKINTKAKKDNA